MITRHLSSFHAGQRYWMSLLLPPVVILAGVLVIAVGIRELDRSAATETWETTRGTITASGVDQRTESSTRSRGAGRTTTYHEQVEYTYSVGDQEYRGDRVTYTQIWSSHRAASEEIVARYPIGSQVTVHYDPAEPHSSVLEPGTSGGTWLPIALGALFTALGGVLFVFGKRWRQ